MSEHDELPLPDYDHLPVGNRLPVVQVLEHRKSALENGAEPSGSVPEVLPELGGTDGGSKVSPATSGPPINPPSHGDPTNPAMPR